MSDALKILSGVVLGGDLLMLTYVVIFFGGMMGGTGSTMGDGLTGGELLGLLVALPFWVLVIVLIATLIVRVIDQSQRRWPLYGDTGRREMANGQQRYELRYYDGDTPSG